MSHMDHFSKICPQSLALSSPDTLKRSLAVGVQSNDSLSHLVMDCTLYFNLKTHMRHIAHTGTLLKIGILLWNVQQSEPDLLKVAGAKVTIISQEQVHIVLSLYGFVIALRELW